MHTTILCNEDWTKNNLIKMNILMDLVNNQIKITIFHLTLNRNIFITNLSFHQKNMRPTLSGNYVFKIYEEEN